MEKLISIIIPVYKVQKYLDRCLESVVNQTYKNLEIILVDDGSPDKCPQLCDDWAKKDSRIKALHIKNNGVANARNQGLKIASGDFVGFVDSDDCIEPNMFETLLNNLVNNNADISVCGYQINNEADVATNLQMVTQFDALKLICMGDYKYGVLWNKLYKKDVVNGVKMPSLVCCEDLIFNYYAFKNANKIVECDSKLYHYFQNESSTVHHTFSVGAFDAVSSKKIMLNEQQNTNLKQYAIRGLISSCFVVLSGCIQSNKFPNDAQKLIDTIIKYRKEILLSPLYSKNDKAKTIILTLSPRIYKVMIKRKHK